MSLNDVDRIFEGRKFLCWRVLGVGCLGLIRLGMRDKYNTNLLFHIFIHHLNQYDRMLPVSSLHLLMISRLDCGWMQVPPQKLVFRQNYSTKRSFEERCTEKTVHDQLWPLLSRTSIHCSPFQRWRSIRLSNGIVCLVVACKFSIFSFYVPFWTTRFKNEFMMFALALDS